MRRILNMIQRRHPIPLDGLTQFTAQSTEKPKIPPLTAFIGISLPCCTSIAAAAYVAVNAPFWYSIPFFLLALVLMPRFAV